MTFEEAFRFTANVGTYEAYTEEELRALWDAASSLTKNALIVEVGLQYGRSSSLLLQLSKVNRLQYIGIDPFDEAPQLWMLGKALPHWITMADSVGCPYMLCVMRTQDFNMEVEPDLVHIDGDHSDGGLFTDIDSFEPKVKLRGFMVFHDYAKQGTEAVKLLVDQRLTADKWERVKLSGSCIVFRRIA